MSTIKVIGKNNAAKDTAALHKALDRGPGNCIRLSGQFLVDRPLIIQNFTRLSGEVMGCRPDYGTIIRATPDFQGESLLQSLSLTAGGYWDRCEIERIHFDGGEGWIRNGLDLTNPGELALIVRCSFAGFSQAAIWCRGIAAQLRLDGCLFSYCQGYFLQLTANAEGKASGNILMLGCSGDDAGRGIIGTNCNAFVTIIAPKHEQPHASPGVNQFADVLVDWRTDDLAGVPAQRDCSPMLSITGGTLNWPGTGTILRVSPANGNPVNVRADFRSLAIQGNPTLVDDQVNGRQVPCPDDCRNASYPEALAPRPPGLAP